MGKSKIPALPRGENGSYCNREKSDVSESREQRRNYSEKEGLLFKKDKLVFL